MLHQCGSAPVPGQGREPRVHSPKSGVREFAGAFLRLAWHPEALRCSGKDHHGARKPAGGGQRHKSMAVRCESGSKLPHCRAPKAIPLYRGVARWQGAGSIWAGGRDDPAWGPRATTAAALRLRLRAAAQVRAAREFRSERSVYGRTHRKSTGRPVGRPHRGH
jgi:hypothetical protein